MDKILGMGNALVDILATLDTDDALRQMDLPKGSMQLIDDQKFAQISDYFASMKTHKATGGSAGNTIVALAALGAETGFIGKVGADDNGRFLQESYEQLGIECKLQTAELPTGIASTFVSPDGERTFGTHLGAAATLKAEDLGLDLFRGYTYLYIEGYLVQDHDMILHAIERAKEAGLQICLDLASYNIVEQDREFLRLIVNKYVDIVFANEEEAKAFTGQEADEAVGTIAEMCSIAVVKRGAQGSLVKKGSETIQVPAVRVDTVVDTTGAGDYFAAGFMYGLTCGYALERCARIGSVLAGHIVRNIGATLPADTWTDVKRDIAQVLAE
ncbi:MAG: adenosine kinase [Bacteroidaceae bacterium]